MVLKVLAALVTWLALGALLALVVIAGAGCAPPMYACFPVTDRGPAFLCGPMTPTPKETTP